MLKAFRTGHDDRPKASRPPTSDPLLAVEHLEVAYRDGQATHQALRDVSFQAAAGERIGIVGESGSGKTTLGLALIGLLPPAADWHGGAVHVQGVGALTRSDDPRWREVRGRRVAMTFQEPMRALTPMLTIGYQLRETLATGRGLRGDAARNEAIRLLDAVAMPDAESRLRSYPYELSGGQRQRALIALALACRPRVLIADEPTTALDVTVQAQVLDVLDDLRAEFDLALVLITHDLGVIARSSDRVLVMYDGEVVEHAPVEALFDAPRHPYTRALLDAVPRLGARGPLRTLPATTSGTGRDHGGCAFAPHCPQVEPRCRATPPEMVAVDEHHHVRCLRLEDPPA